MIFVANHNGQTGNRIVLFLHSLATAIDTRQSLFFLFGSEVRSLCLLVNIKNCVRVYCPKFASGRLWRSGLFVLQKLFRYVPFSDWNRRRYLATLPDRLEQFAAHPKRIHPVLFWDFKNNTALVRHRDEILRIIQIRPEHLQRPDEFLSAFRGNADAIVGVHIRRGDYRGFHGGMFVFSIEDWARFMNSFLDSESERRVVFIIASDEPINIHELRVAGFRGEAFQMPRGTPCEDLALLSRCDFIMGVPSTFSWCAAFLGNRPLLVLRDHQSTCEQSRFRPIYGDEYRIQSWGTDSFIMKTRRIVKSIQNASMPMKQ